MGRHRRQFAGVEFAREPPPCRDATRLCAHHAVDAQQRHAAQNERRDARRQIHALREAAGCHRAFGLRLRQHVGQRVRADRINRHGPALLAERPARRGQFLTRDDFVRPETLQIGFLLGPAGRGQNMPACLLQQRDRHRPDATRSAGHERGAIGGLHAVSLQCHQAQHRRVAGGADGHGLRSAHASGQRHQPVARHTRDLRIAPQMSLTDAPTVENYLIAGLEISMG